MPQDDGFTEAELLEGIAQATGVDITRARFMLGLHRGDTSGDVVVVGGTHTDPPLVELIGEGVTIVRVEGGTIVMVAGEPTHSVLWSEDVALSVN